MENNLISYLEMAEGAIKTDGIRTYDDFVIWLNKLAPDMKNEEYIRTAFESAMKRNKTRVIGDLALRCDCLTKKGYFYRRFVEQEKVLTEDEYDGILKLHGLMRIEKSENGA